MDQILEKVRRLRVFPGEAEDALVKEVERLRKKKEVIAYNAEPVKKASLISWVAGQNQGMEIGRYNFRAADNSINLSLEDIEDFRKATGIATPTPQEIIQKQGKRLGLPNKTIDLAIDILNEDKKQNPSTRREDIVQAASAIKTACEAHDLGITAFEVERQSRATKETIHLNKKRMKKLEKHKHHFE